MGFSRRDSDEHEVLYSSNMLVISPVKKASECHDTRHAV